jgi:hypothetical protein
LTAQVELDPLLAFSSRSDALAHCQKDDGEYLPSRSVIPFSTDFFDLLWMPASSSGSSSFSEESFFSLIRM